MEIYKEMICMTSKNEEALSFHWGMIQGSLIVTSSFISMFGLASSP